SSGVMDSTARTAPRFSWVTGGSPDSISYVTSPTWTYLQKNQKAVSYTDTASLSSSTLGTADQSVAYVLPGGSLSSEAQFLWKASELSSSGMSAGDISGLKLDLSTLGSSIRNLRIGISATAFDSLSADQYLSTGFTEVYFLNTDMGATGWQDFLFHTPFAWDGVSNLVLRFSFDQNTPGTDTEINMANTAFSSGTYLAGTDGYLDFNGSTDYVSLGQGPQIQGSAARTIECWVYTEAFNGGGVFRAGSTGTVGQDFSLRTMGSDNLWRMQQWGTPDFDFTVAGSKNAWRHFAVVYTGNLTMVYVDGKFVAQKSYVLQTGATDMRLGVWNGTRFNGKIDEFRVWNKALNQATIAEWMNKTVTSAHPDYANLVGYYPFDEVSGTAVTDITGTQADGKLFGLPTRMTRNSNELVLNRAEVAARPYVTFEQGSFTTVVTDVVSLDSVPNHAAQLVLYDNPSGPYIIRSDDPLQPNTPTDTLVVWEANRYSYVLDENGMVVDSIFVVAEQTKIRDDHRYFSNIVEYEILRFITPYGINLSLGPNGRTWIYDVTDYAPLLRTNVYLRAGNNQEVLDLKFVMIKGTPPREVKKIENLWSGSFTYSSLLDNSRGEPVSKVLDPTASGYRIKTRTSGHGFGGPTNCAEFCPRDHYLDINGNRLFSWLVWNECATNEIYPQGGTWVYDRAGWCPGEEVSTFDHELTDMFAPGDTLVIDYSLQTSSPPEGNFVLQGQLLTFGAPTRTLDAEIEAILAPNVHFEYSRRNPICGNPKILIRNLGSETLTTIDFTFGVIGGFSPCYYRWTGSLAFLENEEIELPSFNWTGLDPNDPVFYVEMNTVNSVVDENLSNNRLESSFEIAERWIRGSILEVRTNAAANENRYQIVNADDGTVVLDRKNLLSYTTYRDTVDLPDGCYVFQLVDEGVFGGDGLSWWANNDGTGYARLLNPNGTILKNFNGDFGADIYEQFTMGWTAGQEIPRVSCAANGISELIDKPKSGTLAVYPNPSEGSFTVSLEWSEIAAGELLIYDQLGRLVKQQALPALLGHRLDMQLNLEPGIYLLVAKNGKEMMSKSLQIK
ncbi:MAG: peptide-N-glycosidase F-related protein, partial [Bacteroidia bacterium]|nr:peptide-N-glycosidase F-related protein [Bacteroidia bacterium]